MLSARKSTLLAVSCALLLLGACNKPAEIQADDPDSKATAYSLSPKDQRLIAEKYAQFTESPTGLRTLITKEGTGTAHPRTGTLVKANYELRTLDGKVLENSTKDNGGPILFQVGVGRVIKAWESTLPEMRVGEKRTIVVPHWLGYGVAGSPPKIAPYATLVFDIELVSF